MHSLIPLFSCSTNLYCPPVVGTPWVTFKEVKQSFNHDGPLLTWGVEGQCRPLSLGGDSVAPAWSGWASLGRACRGDPPWAAWAPSSAAPPPCPRASAGQSPSAGRPESHWSAPWVRMRINMLTTVHQSNYHLKALFTSFQLVFMAFSALLIMLLASLSSCWDENLHKYHCYFRFLIFASSDLEFLDTWTLFWLSLFQDSGTDLLTRMFWIREWLSSSPDSLLSFSQIPSILTDIF